ncbi:sensor histidine kinase [Streptomyces sp. AC495_CC817]|uniref:sensor histidine kinase n=1 Tax=Streptomyces sp. AC495_CC817 TaxID=2823900 RepID=UPI001C255D18|nr:sensor histidine kinase [Streptomyces sp. AC495_CC817]
MAVRSPRSRRLSPRVLVLSALAAAAIALFSVLVPLQTAAYGTLLPLSFLLAAGVCAAPLLSITRPRTAIAVFCVAVFVLPLTASAAGGAAAPWPWSVPALLSFVLLVGVVTYRHGAGLGVIPLLVGLAATLAAPLVRGDIVAGDAATANLIVAASVSGGAYLIAVLLAGRARIGEELTREREHSAVEESRRELVEERARIARELHDVIAHSMSVIQVQASTARYRLPELGEAAVGEFDDIAATARASLTEMRRMLGVLRTEDQAAELAPQQGIDDVPALVEGVRRAGAAVDIVIDGDAAGVPSSVQIASFRIVQEALSNAVRHAPGAPIRVGLVIDEEAVHIRVRNDAARSASTATGSGFGLRGMRERATLLGGTLSAGPSTDGGWTVEAAIPVAPSAAPAPTASDRENT